MSELVAVVSDDPAMPDEEGRKDEVRERERHAGVYALAVYAADTVSKVRELQMPLASGSTSARPEMGVDELDGHCSLAHGGRAPLGRAGPGVARGEDAGNAGG